MDITSNDVSLISTLISAPSFAALFVYLFVKTRQEAERREAAYIKTIRGLQHHTNVLSDMLRKCGMVPPEHKLEENGDQ